MVVITIVRLGYKPTNITRGPHIVDILTGAKRREWMGMEVAGIIIDS